MTALRRFPPNQNGRAADCQSEADVVMPPPLSIRELTAQYPRLAEPVIDGFLRAGETANLVAPPKGGKSWLAYSVALAVASGSPWLGRFPCTRGRVLLIDNELHPGTIAHRLPKVAEALSLDLDDLADNLHVQPLRGRLADLDGILRALEGLPSGAYSLVILDAWYRALPADVSENANADVAALYNSIDRATERLGCAWLNIHHAAKGPQGDKAVSDVGAGAGAQSRAADAHIALRPHTEPGAIVLEAVVRSFPPVAPVVLRWGYPVWRIDSDLDAAHLRGRKVQSSAVTARRDQEGLDQLRDALAAGPMTVRQLRASLRTNQNRVERLAGRLIEAGEVVIEQATVKGNQCQQYRLRDVEHST